MADTARTIAALLALFADNTTGDISEQDCRDLIVSFVGSYGGMYTEGNATETEIAVADTWYKVLGTTTAYADLQDFTMSANNRLLYGGTITKHFNVAATLALTAASNNQTGEFSIHKNGTIVPGSTIEFKCLATGDPRNASVIAQVDMAPGDYVELFIKNETSTANMTVTYGNINVSGHVHTT